MTDELDRRLGIKRQKALGTHGFTRSYYEYSEVEWESGKSREGTPLCPFIYSKGKPCARPSPDTGRRYGFNMTEMMVVHACPVHGEFEVNWS